MTTGDIDSELQDLTEAQKVELEEEENKSWTSYVSKVFIILKCTVVMLLLIQTFVAWFRSRDQMKAQALEVRKLVLFQCATCMILLLGATTFDFVPHYTHFYLGLFILASYVFYASLYIVLKIGAVELPDVAVLQKKMNSIFIIICVLTTIVGLNGGIKHDFSAWCIPYTYFPLIQFAKLLNSIWNLISIGIYMRTIKFKTKEKADLHMKEPEDKKEHRRIYEGMFATYNCFCIALLIVRLIVTLIGQFMIKKKGWVICSSDGLRWMFINQQGTIFLTTHVVLLIIICVMTKTLYGKTALKLGLIPNKTQDKVLKDIKKTYLPDIEGENLSVQEPNRE